MQEVGLPRPIESSLSLSEFFREFIYNYKNFIQNKFSSEKPPFFYLIIWLAGMVKFIDRMEMMYVQDFNYFLDNWITAWTLTILLGVPLGYLYFWIAGAIYHLGVRLSGGINDIIKSRNVFLYSGLPVFIGTLLMQLFDTVYYGDKYFTGFSNFEIDLLLLAFFLIAAGYSIYLSYTGVRLLLVTKQIRSVIFFIVVPAGIYAAVFTFAFLSSEKYYSPILKTNDRAIQLMYKGEYREAERLFKQALARIPEGDYENRYTFNSNLALLYENEGNLKAAEAFHRKSLEYVDRDMALYHSTLGNISLLKGDLHAAIENFGQALKINPNDFDAHNSLGLIYMGDVSDEVWDYKLALEHNRKAFEINPEITAMSNLAQNYFLLEDYSETIRLCDSLITLDSGMALPYLFKGLSFYLTEFPDSALVYLSQAITLEPGYLDSDLQEILNDLETTGT